MHWVLVVDDESAIADSLGEILRRIGFEVSVAYNSQDALRMVNEAQNQPGMLITDVVLDSEMTGIDLAIEVEKQCPNCKVLLFSGVPSSAELLEEARKMGHDFEFISKPVHPQDLIAKVH